MPALDLFSTPVLIVPDAVSAALCTRLRQSLITLSEQQPGIQRSNAGGGWHSDTNLLRRPDMNGLGDFFARQAREALAQLASRTGQPMPHIAGVHVQAWAMVLPDRAWVMPHDHADAHLSGVLHLDHGDGSSGNLTLLDPRSCHLPWAPLDPTTFELPPRVGQLVWFPSGLQHWVSPVQGASRASVAVNVRFDIHPAPDTPR
jgi:hypothetical protein